MAFEPIRTTRETDYFLCKITPEKGLEVLGTYPFSKAEQRRDTLQEANMKKLTELRYCIRPLMDGEARASLNTTLVAQLKKFDLEFGG